MDGSALLAGFNALCNASAGVLLFLGWRAIRRRNVVLHKRLMLGAFGVSALFLVSYLTRMTVFGAKHFEGTGLARTAYLGILLTHSVLAAAILPLVLRTVYLPLRERFDPHRRIARWTFPLWAYVSVTGVIVYVMLYHF